MNHHKHKMEEHDEHHHDAPVEDSEIREWKKKLVGSWTFATPVAMIMIAEKLFGMSFISKKIMIPLLLILGFPIVFIFGWSTIRSGMNSFRTFYFNMDSLIALGTIIA